MKNGNLISILVPCYNEEEVLQTFYDTLTEVVNSLTNYTFEFLFIDDGSKDKTLYLLKKLHSKDNRVRYISLSRNFGKEIAMAAGIDNIKGDAVIIMDADLQDPPSLIPDMIAKWKEGFDDVYAKRSSRKGESFLKKASSKFFYKVLAKLARVEIQSDTGDFRLLSKKAINSLREYRESERYTKGYFSLIGFKKTSIKFDRDPRFAGETKWNYIRLIELAINGITSFSTAPLKLASYFGFLLSLLSFIFMIYIILKALFFGEVVRGYTSLISIILFLGGVQLLSIGILGEYIGRTFLESKNRPLYFIQESEKSVDDFENS